MRRPEQTKTTPAADERGYMDINAAAAYLDISPRTLQQWVAARKIEFIRAGRLTKFTKAQLDRFMTARTIVPGQRRGR